MLFNHTEGLSHFIKSTKPVRFHAGDSVSAKILKQAYLDKQLAVYHLNIYTDPIIHPKLKTIVPEGVRYVVGVPIIAKSRPAGILWGLRKYSLNQTQIKDARRQLTTLSNGITYILPERMENVEAYNIRKNIEELDTKAVIKRILTLHEKNLSHRYKAIFFHSYRHKTDFRMDVSYLVPASNKYRISLKRILPRKLNDTDKTLLLVPGLFCNRVIMDLFAREMALKYGYQTFQLNMRGRSPETLPHDISIKTWTIDDYILEDFPAAVRWIGENDHKQIVVLGHSMGGIIARAYVGAYEVLKKKAGTSSRYLPDPYDHIAGIVAIASPSIINLQTSLSRFGVFKQKAVLVPNIFANMFMNQFAGLMPTIDLQKFFTFMHQRIEPSKKALYDTANIEMMQQFLGYPQISPPEWYFFVENVFSRESLKVVNQFLKAQLRKDHQLTSYDGKINYSRSFRNINLPIKYFVAKKDKIAPPESVLTDFDKIASSDKSFVYLDQGHLGIIMHRPTIQRMGEMIHQWIMDLER